MGIYWGFGVQMAVAKSAIRERDLLDDLFDSELERVEEQVRAEADIERAAEAQRGGWPAYGRTVHPVTGFDVDNVPLYVSKRSGKHWCPRSEEERRAILEDTPRYVLLRGGEGSGKSAGAVIKLLERLRRGMDWIFVSPDFEHFKTSAWPLLREWCPTEVVDKSDRHMMEESWEAARKFELHARSESGRTVTLRCAGIDDPHSVRGGNVHGATFDEASRHKDATAFKFLAGRVRLLGPEGEPPQLVLSTTPEMNWLYDYFGPLKADEEDPFESFKQGSLDVVLDTSDNLPNLDPDYVRERSAVLTEAEQRVYMRGEWESLDGGARFLESMIWFDDCRDTLPPLKRDEPLIAAVDAGISDDPFGLVAVGRHPYREGVLCPRLVRLWTPPRGQQLDFDSIESEIEALKRDYNILSVHYDPYQLHQMMTGLRRKRIVHTVEFPQGGDRNAADKGLLDLIQQRRLAWSPDTDNISLLRAHLDNADRKLTEDRKLRIVKRTQSRKIDLAVALAMASHRGSRLWRKRREPEGTTSSAGMR